MTRLDWLDQALWPSRTLGELLDTLASCHGLQTADSARQPAHDVANPSEDHAIEWLAWAAGKIGVEALPVSATVRELPQVLASGGPAILHINAHDHQGYLALSGSRSGNPEFLCPNHGRLRVRKSDVETLLASDLGAKVRPEVERVLEKADVRGKRRARVADAMISERIAGETIDGIYLLRLPATAEFGKQVWQAGIANRLFSVIVLFFLIYSANLWGWSLIGGATLSGRVDWGWLGAWLLVLFTMVPWRLLAGWNEAIFALDTGRLVKSRLLAGAFAMPSDTVKRRGVGQLISQVMESQALESLALGGGFSVLVGTIELGFAAWVLHRGVAGSLHLALLGIFALLTLFLAMGFHRRIGKWTSKRLDMTHYLVEAMVGHRTRLAQERESRRDGFEDGQLFSYLEASRSMDLASIRLASGLSAGWSIVSLVACAPALAQSGNLSSTMLAISLGGIMLGQNALNGIAGGLASLSRAGFAWRRVAEIFKAGARNSEQAAPAPIPKSAASGAVVLEARNLRYDYDNSGRPVIDGVNLAIARGDRILVEGPSGGGKSTLAGLLTGLRPPSSGLLLLDGLDRPTIGDDWHSRVTAAPQFHENHILSGTLAFNLLMGRHWPASEADIAEAEQLCEELGLGSLLRRMPGGIHQRVGETGWQLSHGERSRIFLARALLQKADVTILDESFASLDPATMSQCLNTALQRSETLVVIAHP